jgi:2-polyprenyl-3-methyl-5-hydroxy-6-metoxy-1,4-benzoquinol methylase
MPNMSERVMTPELMDSEETDLDTFRACLVDLARVNQLTLAYRPTLTFLNRLLNSGHLPRDRAVVIVDIGSGYGDMLRKVDRWAARRGIKVKLIGLDLNPWSARSAAEVTPKDRPIRWLTANVFDFRPEERVDVIMSSLFTHHLDNAALVRFVAWMEANAGTAWFVNDLHRHPLPYHVFRFLSRALRFHDFVQHDGPISIARAFNAADWQLILARAGVPAGAAKVRWYFPFRICVERVCGA